MRTYFARNLFEGIITPPADFTLASANCERQVFDLNYAAGGGPVPLVPINSETNVHFRSAGVYSNFADGLVFKNAWQRVDLEIRVVAYTRGSTLTGTAAVPNNSKTITGAGTAFVAEVGANDLLEIVPIGGPPREVGIVDVITDNTHLDLNNYPLTNFGNCELRILTPVETIYYDVLSLPVLNAMYYVNHFISLTGVERDGLLLDARLNNSPFSAHDTVFLTKSISPDFEDAVHFDGALDIEFTEATV